MLAIVLTSLWAPALVSFQARDMPRKARVLPLDSNLRNSGRFADIVASTAGQLIVNEIVVSDLVDDAPTIPRLLRVLQTPPRRILQQSGDLAVVAALLVGSSWGLRVMKTLVMQELAGEPLAFIRAAAALRTFSQAVIAPSAEAGTPRTPTLLRNPIRAPPIVAISICSPQPHVPLQVPICSPQPDAPLPSAATPRLEQPMMPAVDLPTQDASPALLTPPRAGHSSRPRRPTVTRQTSLSGISSHLHRLMSRYVAEGSPMQVGVFRLMGLARARPTASCLALLAGHDKLGCCRAAPRGSGRAGSFERVRRSAGCRRCSSGCPEPGLASCGT